MPGEYIAGRNTIIEALKAKRTFKKILFEESVKSSKDTRINDIIRAAKEQGIALEQVKKKDLGKIERKINVKSDGVIALLEEREEIDTKGLIALCKKKNKEPFIIVINNILYEENLGAVLRTAAASGVDGIIIPKRDKRDINANVARISMGGSEYVPLVKDNLFESLDYLKEEGLRIFGVELNGTDYYFDEDLKGPVALVFGGEDAGLTEPLAKRCEKILRIPMIGKIQSLNVSVSVAIVLYEKIRQECQN